jgi:hypothetical protein
VAVPPVPAGVVSALQATVVSDGQIMVGPVTSRTTMDLEQVAVLPQASVAVQVRVWIPDPAQAPGAKTVVKVIIGGTVLQASVAVGGVKTGVAGQLIGVVCATQIMTGAVTS